MEEEIWRDVVGYEGIYTVSNYGRVKRVAAASGTRPGALLKGVTIRGYTYIGLYKDGERKLIGAHRLVSRAFIGVPPDYYPQVNHLDGDKKNNRVDNLEYTDDSGNLLHSFRTLGRKPHVMPGEKNPNSVLTEEKVREIKRLYEDGKGPREISILFPEVAVPQIRKIGRGKSWKHIL